MIANPPNQKPSASDSSGANRMVRQRRAGMEIAIAEHSGFREFHISVRPLPEESLSQCLRRLGAVLKEYDATIVRQEVFGSVDAHAEGIETLASLFGAIAWPLNWIEGGSGNGQICGTHVLAISGTRIDRFTVDGKVAGVLFNDRWARHCVLGNIHAANTTDVPSAQTERVYSVIEQELSAAAMTVHDVVRTWFFLDHILDWYGDFNKVRNAFYSRQTPRPKCFPASTGISGKNPARSALSVAAWAMQPIDQDAYFGEVLSPLQCPAPDYGSGFSRAAEIVTPGYRRIFVSGTASIHPGGESARPNDIDGQVELTMEVVDAILRTRNMTFADVTRATLYFKNISQAPSFQKWCAAKGWSDFPAIATEAHVCRDELLFEIELDAMMVGSNGGRAS